MSTSKKVVLITGGNTGLGLEVVKALSKSKQAYEIIIGCRNLDSGKSAIAQLQAENSSTSSTFSAVQVDLTSDESITQARETVAAAHDRIDVLINNGGAGFDGQIRDKTMTMRDAWNASWDVNVSGTMVLTSEFVPLLLKSSDPRLMFVTSGTASCYETENITNPVLERINGPLAAGWPKKDEVNPITSYRSSKTGLNMAMREWYRFLKNDGVKVWAISPGFLATGLGGVGVEQLKKMGAQDPSVGGEFIKTVVEGQRDHEQGKVIRANMVQPW